MIKKIISLLSHSSAQTLIAIIALIFSVLGFILVRPIEKLEYSVLEVNDFLQVSESGPEKLEMKFKNQSVKKLSYTIVQISNRTGKNYSNVELDIVLQPDSSGKIPMLVSLPNTTGPTGYSDSSIILKSQSHGKFTFNIPTINTSDYSNEFTKFFKVSFIVMGEKSARVEVKMVPKPGLEMSKFDLGHFASILGRNLIVCTISLYLATIIVACWIVIYLRRKNEILAKEKLRQLSQGNNASLNLDPTQIPEIVEIVLNRKSKKDIITKSK
jgi:hypothetical protein